MTFFLLYAQSIPTLPDAILLGDFNAGCSYVVQGEFEQIRLYNQSRFHWLISDHADTTTKTTSCPYDRWDQSDKVGQFPPVGWLL